jgi:ABC-type multidrug transport system ATPase subunit/pSer/pThr/pTyr-binding forkhead associated (FHA) protein
MTAATLSVTTGNGAPGGAIQAVVKPRTSCLIGRSIEADVLIDDVRVSRRHLLIEPEAEGWRIRDVSTNGSWHNGVRLEANGLLVLQAGTVRIFLGDPVGPEVAITYQAPPVAETVRPAADRRLGPATVLRRRTDLPASDPGRSVGAGGITRLDHQQQAAHELATGRITVGRDPHSDVHLPDLLVSRNHAELRIAHNEAEIVDLGSANGTFVNGQRVTRAPVYEGDVITIGHYLLQVEGSRLVEFVDTGDVSFEAQDLAVFAGQKQLMHDVSFSLPARTLLAVVGPSGAGKSTLLNALTGFRPADSGTVWYAGRDLYSSYDELRRRIGYVPQEDLLHTSLTVRKALEYGAELRFPPDVTSSERSARVDEVLAELGLTQHADTQVSRLSGGQRKRTSVALELLTKPSLLYLDEPTSGLDPGLDKSVMQSLRTLADDGRTVVVVTHSVANLDVCDLVLMLAPGGHVAYFGPPRGALAYFGEADFADTFLALEATPGAEWGDRFRSSNMYRAAAAGRPRASRIPEELPNIRQQPVRKQLSTLVRRYLSVVVSDKSYTRLIIAFPLLLGIIPRVVPAKNGLHALPTEPNQDAPTVLMVLILCACFMGMANSVREIVKERSIYRRERSIGLSLPAYLGSKVVVLTMLTAPQALVFTLIGVLGRTPSEGVLLGSALVEVVIAVIVTAVASVMLGLVVSTLVDSADKTMPLLVLITMAQLVLSGGLVPLVGKPGLEQIAWFVPARWGYAAVASSIDLNRVLMAGNPNFKSQPSDPLWDHTAATYLTDLACCMLVGVGCLVLCALLLRRADPKPNRGRPARKRDRSLSAT